MSEKTQNLTEASRQWASRPADERYETLAELTAAVRERRMRSRSVDIETGRTEVSADGAGLLTINGSITPCEPTHWSFGQLSQVIGGPAGYLRTLPADLLVKNLNHGLRVRASESLKFMTIARPDGAEGANRLQAITSPTYGRIWDADVVEAVGRIVERSGGKFHNPMAYSRDGGPARPQGLYASDRDVFVFMIDGGSMLEAGPRAELHRGFFAWNSEVGAKTFGLRTFLFNRACGNHIVWGARDINEVIIRHTSGGPYRFDSQAAPALLAHVNAPGTLIENTIKKAQGKVVWDGQDGSLGGLLESLSRVSKFSRSELTEAIRFAKSEEGDARTLWQLVQGFTAYARGFDWIDARIDLETRAGKLMNMVDASN